MNEYTKVKSASPYFSVVIPAYNEEVHIGSSLQSIFDSNYDSTKYEVIVVDNGSQDYSYNIALNFRRAKVFELPQGNVGAVRNYGAAQARGQVLIFIDADCLIDKEWFNRTEKLINDYPSSAYGGGIKLPTNARWIEKSWLLQKNGQPILPKHLIGASTVLPKELFIGVGGFNEAVSSGEDTDLHLRLLVKNIPVIIDSALNVTHLGNAKTSMQFIRRQIWHSENYIANITQALKDPTFFLTIIFLILPFLAIMQGTFSSQQNITIIIFLMWGFIPAIFSLKRLIRANFFTLTPKDLFKIYSLDFLYLTGRCLGLLKGLFNLLVNTKIGKIIFNFNKDVIS